MGQVWVKKRNLFAELMQGVAEMAAHRENVAKDASAAGCYHFVKHLDLDPTMSMTCHKSNLRQSSVLTCGSSCTDHKAGRND